MNIFCLFDLLGDKYSFYPENVTLENILNPSNVTVCNPLHCNVFGVDCCWTKSVIYFMAKAKTGDSFS